MILTPFDPESFAPIAALFAQEPPVQADNTFARRLALLGCPGPFRSSPSNAGLILDRADHPIEHVMPTVQGAAVRRDVAEITALALNRLCGFAAVEDRLDADHLAGVQAESARFEKQAGGRAEAAE